MPTLIEKIVYGDKVLGVNQRGELVEYTVMLVTLHEKNLYEMTDIQLQSGKMISTTFNHMMVVYLDGKSALKRASDVEVGDIFFSRDFNGTLTEDKVIDVKTY